MSRLIVLMLFIVGFVAFAQPSFAADPTRIRGNAYNVNNGTRVAGETVTVVCNGVTKTAVTDANGLYVVDYTNAQCNQFQAVTASLTFNGNTQSQTVFVSDNYRATLDFYFEAASVPEFGLLPGMFAAAASAGSYLLLKRKQS